MPDDVIEQDTGQIPTNLRLLMLLEEVARAGVPVTPSVINESMRLPKPTIHRLFATAEAEGFLQRDIDGRSYSPGRRMRLLATNTLSSERVRTVRLAVLKSLAIKVGETCNLAIPERDGMFYLDRVETHWPLRIQLPVGTQVPFHCTASGKMYLSTLRPDYLERFLKNYALEKQTEQTITDPRKLQIELDKTRARGYATDNEEFMSGMTAIAVPILDDRGRLLSTLSIHAPEQRRHLPQLVECLGLLQEAAVELAAIVGR
ncbi:MAG: IclR family transcriptional regulator [Yoonia sp.]|uniref:IclR family transcriptional regulator n=1 Tax=Yoonia sp. TaxID=2212373 RepID=UPI00273EDC60|nr:IclR family transcriptional regulator [Yoonia sp.]MDP5086268.1 IclR family transcriptional regulator [Yoonia sp.]MDP5361884.1 IclR family transcriptional regulator [Paracoccaceae bacterium]